MIIIFDLDGTVICTKHRYRNLPDGTIDLDYWFANAVPEKIAQDTLLPLASTMKHYYADNHYIVICTARTMSTADYDYVNKNLPYHVLLSRPENDFSGDGELKSNLLNQWAKRRNLPENWRENAIMFDDNIKVIQRMIADKLLCYDAAALNAKLAA